MELSDWLFLHSLGGREVTGQVGKYSVFFRMPGKHRDLVRSPLLANLLKMYPTQEDLSVKQ